ncbi:flagellar operon protein (TIGR03826 family) [Oikeobacillus pervagus]|uniref:Flagellar operon protein (TIGR03826 family) n=1 Tax=Oikeobacillus pervagus TaxID=1325931 RepID=A0AAJ1T2Y1_9BACI|nr:TIGR03826 family flagellar region protein [Oikeobacillus pervagus]MDQ0214959.1 flagellar operon protein (TIGR03826 family) [Oikeobacillus pervagus]
MDEIINCPSCGELFLKNSIHDVCRKCYLEEEKAFEIVYKFLRKRENRAATLERVVEATGVEEELIHKFVRKGRLQTTQFPNMGYPCDRCGMIIHKGKLCAKCIDSLKHDLKVHEQEEQRKEELRKKEQITYYAVNKKE